MKYPISEKHTDFFWFLLSSNLFYFAIGLFTPFWVVFINSQGGSLSQFGLLMGSMGLAGGVTTFFLSAYSDRIGQKKIFIFLTFLSGLTVLCYSLETKSIYWLYMLQIIYGIVGTAHVAIETAFVGNLTSVEKRGSQVGVHRGTISIMAALAMIIGGYFVEKTGLVFIFYITALLIFISAFLVFPIRERWREG